MIRAITALTLAVGMCLSSAAFAAPVAPKAKVTQTQILRKSKLAPVKTLKKTAMVKRQPRLPSRAHDKIYRGKIKAPVLLRVPAQRQLKLAK